MKKIIAAALSFLVGAFGFTVVDTALENRVATLESQVVELQEYHHATSYSPETYTTSRYTTTGTGIHQLAVGDYLNEYPNAQHKFLLRSFSNGVIRYISPNSFSSSNIYSTTPTAYPMTTTELSYEDHYLYITESSAQILNIEDEISNSYWFDKNYSSCSTAINRSKTTILLKCKGMVEPTLAGNSITFVCFSLDARNSVVTSIKSDGSFEFHTQLTSYNALRSDCDYAIEILGVNMPYQHTTMPQYHSTNPSAAIS